MSSLRRPCIEALRACVRGLSHVHLGWPASGIDMPRTLISRSHDALSASICGSQFFGIDSLVFCNIIQYIPYAFKIPYNMYLFILLCLYYQFVLIIYSLYLSVASSQLNAPLGWEYLILSLHQLGLHLVSAQGVIEYSYSLFSGWVPTYVLSLQYVCELGNSNASRWRSSAIAMDFDSLLAMREGEVFHCSELTLTW